MAAAGTNPLPDFWDAAFQGDLSSLRDHIPSGVDVNAWPPAWKSAYQPTALSYAVWGNQPSVVKLLLQNGADPNQPDGVRRSSCASCPPCPPPRRGQPPALRLCKLRGLDSSPSAGRELPPAALGVVQERPRRVCPGASRPLSPGILPSPGA